MKKIDIRESIDLVIEHVWEQQYLAETLFKVIPLSKTKLKFYEPIKINYNKEKK